MFYGYGVVCVCVFYRSSLRETEREIGVVVYYRGQF